MRMAVKRPRKTKHVDHAYAKQPKSVNEIKSEKSTADPSILLKAKPTYAQIVKANFSQIKNVSTPSPSQPSQPLDASQLTATKLYGAKPTYAQMVKSNSCQNISSPSPTQSSHPVDTSQHSPTKLYFAEPLHEKLETTTSPLKLEINKSTQPQSTVHDQFNSELILPPHGNVMIDNHNFSVYEVPGDGSCFFHALSLGLHGNFSASLQYRSSVCKQIYNNFMTYKSLIDLCHDNIKSPHEYWNGMVVGSQYATSCEIMAACSVLNVNINILVQGLDSQRNICFTNRHLQTLLVTSLLIFC